MRPHLAAKIIVVHHMGQHIAHILGRVPTLDLRKYELFTPDAPHIWLINWCINIMSSNREIWVSRFRGPCIESERYLAGEPLHALMHLFLGDLYMSKYLSTKGAVRGYVLLRKRRMAEFEEAVKTSLLDQTKHLNVKKFSANQKPCRESTHLIFTDDKLDNVVN
jgi:hypothetical protein